VLTTIRSVIVNWIHERVVRWGAIGTGHPRANRYGRFGDSSMIGFPTGTVYGERWMHIGSRTMIADHVTMSVGIAVDQQMVTNPVIRIGDDCLIGRYNAIIGHFSIDIADGVYTGMNVYITDQNHSYEGLDEIIGKQVPVEAPVRIGKGSWIGSGAVILPGSDIGEHVVVAANSVVRGTIPDRCVVAGVPARVVRQHDDEAGWVKPSRAGGPAEPSV